MQLNTLELGWMYARNKTSYYSIVVDPLVVRGREFGRDIITTTALSHNYAFVGPGAGVHAFISSYTPRSGKEVGLPKPNYAELSGVNFVTYGLTAIRAEGGALISIYYQN